MSKHCWMLVKFCLAILWFEVSGVFPGQSFIKIFYMGYLTFGSPCWDTSPAHGRESHLHTCKACTSPYPRQNTRPQLSWGYVWRWTWLIRWGWYCSPVHRQFHNDHVTTESHLQHCNSEIMQLILIMTLTALSSIPPPTLNSTVRPIMLTPSLPRITALLSPLMVKSEAALLVI